MMKASKRIEQTTSRTAEYTCVSRAVSYFEKNPCYKSDDHVAAQMVPNSIRSFLKLSLFREFYKHVFAPNGMYEYVTVRTKYIDAVVKNAIGQNVDQILIFGAGFDSRGIRFLNAKSTTKVFELDVPITQQAKIGQLKKRQIAIPSQMVFVPIDFTKESLEDKLLAHGFQKGKKSLFVLEGLTMYLNKEAMDATFGVIQQFSGKDSEIVFDHIYASVLRQENRFYGEAAIYKKVKRAGEGWTFGIEKNRITIFLDKIGYQLMEQLDSKELEKRYFTNPKNKTIAKINGTHGLVYARK